MEWTTLIVAVLTILCVTFLAALWIARKYN
jgi:hypothetical protein